MAMRELVTRDPAILGGEPVFAVTRVPIKSCLTIWRPATPIGEPPCAPSVISGKAPESTSYFYRWQQWSRASPIPSNVIALLKAYGVTTRLLTGDAEMKSALQDSTGHIPRLAMVQLPTAVTKVLTGYRFDVGRRLGLPKSSLTATAHWCYAAARNSALVPSES